MWIRDTRQLRSVSASPDTPRRSFFTLLEVVVAFTIFSLLVVTLVTFAREVTKSWGRLRREESVIADLLVLERTLDSIFTNAVPFIWRDESGEQVPFFIGESDRVRLAYMHRPSQFTDQFGAKRRSALRFVELGLTGKSDSVLTASYRGVPSAEWESTSADRRQSILTEGVSSIEFVYADWSESGADRDSGELEWRNDWEWDPESIRKELPLGIGIFIEWTDGKREFWLRRISGSGFRERWGHWQPRKNLPR